MITSIDDTVIYIDVDETLILSGDGLFVPQIPNESLIGQIKDWKGDGRKIIVWTSNGDGVQHAIKIVKQLGIEDYIDLCLPKPRTIVDDDHLEYYNTIDPITLEWK